MGRINNELRIYEKSLEFHQIALEYQDKLNDPILRASSLNNIDVVCQNMTKYSLSIIYFDKALKIDSLYHEEPRLYTMLIDNLVFQD